MVMEYILLKMGLFIKVNLKEIECVVLENSAFLEQKHILDFFIEIAGQDLGFWYGIKKIKLL